MDGYTMYSRRRNADCPRGNSSSRPCCASVCTVARDRMEMPMPSAMHRLSAAASSMTAMTFSSSSDRPRFWRKYSVSCLVPVLLAMDAMQDHPGKLIRVLGDEAHTRKNIEKMLEYENKSGQTTVRPDGCFEIVFQA